MTKEQMVKEQSAIAPKTPPVDAAPESTVAAPKKRTPRGPSVNLSLPLTQRPLAGFDVTGYVDLHNLDRVQIVERLAMASVGKFTVMARATTTPLPFEVELLLRWYIARPVQPHLKLPIDVFQAMYGELLEQFKPENKEAARIMLYGRFARALGRSVYSAYRWFKRNDNGAYGVANAPLRRLFSMLPQEPQAMRIEVEDLARTVYRARGIDFDTAYPLPSVESPPVSRRLSAKQMETLQAEAAIAAAEKAPAVKKAAAKKVAVKKAAADKALPVKKVAVEKAPPVKKAAAKEALPVKKVAVKKAVVEKAAKSKRPKTSAAAK